MEGPGGECGTELVYGATVSLWDVPYGARSLWDVRWTKQLTKASKLTGHLTYPPTLCPYHAMRSPDLSSYSVPLSYYAMTYISYPMLGIVVLYAVCRSPDLSPYTMPGTRIRYRCTPGQVT
eukprot:3187130-Rhodomonas_salina.2